MIKRIQKLIMAVMVFTLVSTQIIYAHPSSQSGIINWSELCGWGINEDTHSNSTNITYYFYSGDSNLTDAYKTIIRNGASKWSSYGTVSESSSGTGKIHTFISTDTTVGEFYYPASDSSGHLTFWTIRFARNRPFTSTTAAHEFGHAYGLYDLYDVDNYNKLMCGNEGRTVTIPTTQDLKGFRVIMGQHISHTSWAYKANPDYPSTVAAHIKYCTNCDGYNMESCSPARGKCTKCGIYH